MAHKMDPKVERMIEAAQAQGWTVERTAQGHLLFTSPDKSKPRVYGTVSSTDYRGALNMRAALRRSGLRI